MRRPGVERVSLAAVIAMLTTASACEALVGINDTTEVFYIVRGTAAGVLEPLSLELRHAGGSENIEITEEGEFSFATILDPGDSYTVTFVGQPPCVLDGDAGTVADVNPMVTLICEGVAALTNLEISGPTAPDFGFSSDTLTYVAEVSLLQQSAGVIATSNYPEASITVQGAMVMSGMPSAPLLLALGDNSVDVDVTHPSGFERSYQVTIRRAGEIAQHAYGKASNTGGDDQFGARLELDGDTLVVGAWGEDSAATGINGNESENDASDSGAVYVYRRSGTQWQQEAYIKASNTGAGDQFGRSLALYGDTLAVGAPYEDSVATGIDGDQDSNGANESGAVYLFRRNGTEWQQKAYIKASNTGAGDRFGWSVALSGETLAVGAQGEASIATGNDANQGDNSAGFSGAVYVYRQNGAQWQQEAYVKASNTGAGDRFGWSVALSGDTLAVGAFGEDSNARGINGNQTNDIANNSGAVYVYRRSGTEWQQEAYIKASNTDAEDTFGQSMALSGDTLAVGAPYEDSVATGINGDEASNSETQSGAVYVYRRNGTEWQQEAYIKASNTNFADVFGASVTLSGDILAVGADLEDSTAMGIGGNENDNSASASGAVYLYRWSGSAWQLPVYIKASNTGAYDWFGASVALSGDTLAVGAYGEDSAATGMNGNQADNGILESGAVYVFH